MIKFHRLYRRQVTSSCRRDYATFFEQVLERYRLGEPGYFESNDLGPP
jgi:hypothetical protein